MPVSHKVGVVLALVPFLFSLYVFALGGGLQGMVMFWPACLVVYGFVRLFAFVMNGRWS